MKKKKLDDGRPWIQVQILIVLLIELIVKETINVNIFYCKIF